MSNVLGLLVNQCWGSGSGSACVWASQIRILPFSHKGIEWTEIMLAKYKNITQNFSKILNFKD
jgi:hypothetical protein